MTRAVIGSLRVNMGIDTAAFTAGLQNAQKHLARVTKQMQAIGRQMSATVTAPMALIGTSVVRTAADFEQAMANMAAVLRPTQEEFKKLEERAISLAQTTKYTATEAADGMEMLARNGIDAANILGGAAEATLNLASAAGASLPSAADAMTDVMVAFRKSGAELTDVVNNIAGTLVNSKMGWEDYYGAMSQSAGVAGSMGMSFSEMNAVLAATAPAFKNGTEAGTSFKGFLLKLAPSSKQAKKIMEDLNLQFFTATGEMRSMGEIAEELRTKIGDTFTKESQLEILGTLFGQRTIRTALALMAEGEAGIDRFRSKIAEGNAEAMSAKKLDTLWGSWNMMRAAIESASIAIGKSGFRDWARSVVDAVAGMARWVAALNPEILRLTAIMAGLVAAAGPVVVTISAIVAGIMLLGGPITWTILAVTALATAIAAYWTEIKTATRVLVNVFADLYSAIKGWCESVYNAVKEWLVDKFGWAIDLAKKVLGGFKGAFKSLSELDDVKRYGDQIRENIDSALDTVKDSGSSAAAYVAAEWKKASDQIKADADAAAKRIQQLADWRKVFVRRSARAERERLLSGLPRRNSSDDPTPGRAGTQTYDVSQHEDAERIIKAMQTSRDSIRKQIASLQIEAATFGMSSAAAAQYRIEQQLLAEAIENKIPITGKLIDKNRELAQSMASATARLEGMELMRSLRTPAQVFGDELERIAELARVGAITFDEFNQASARLKNDFSGLTQIADSVSDSFGSALEDMIIDGASWRDSLAGFLKDIARELLRVAAITPLMNALKSGITSSFGSGGGLSLGNLMGFANGGSFQVGGTGGIDSQLVAFRASPNERVTITKPGQEGGGGSSAVFNINIDASGADVAAVSRLEGALAQFKQEMPRMIANTTVNLRDRGMA